MKQRILRTIFGAILIATTSLVQAQVLEEIVVTAQKREQNAQDLPMSILAISGETANRLGVSNSEDVVKSTVNLNVTSSVGEGVRPAYFMRGVGLNDFNTNNAGPVGVYLDEVYLSNIASQMVPLFDVDRIEVLRGPQGTLFGRNTSAGAISFFSKAPTQELDGYVKASFGNYSTSKIEGAIGGPFSDAVSGRLSVLKIDSDGQLTNLAGSGQEGGRDILAWRGQVLYPGDRFELLLNLHGGEDNSEPNGYQHVGLVDPATGVDFCTPAQVGAGQCTDFLGYMDTSGDFYSGEYDFDFDTDSETFGGVVRMTWDFDNMTVTSVTGFDVIDQKYFEDADSSPLAQAHVTYGVEADTLSQELRAVGGSDRIDWIVGAYYLTEELDQNQTADLFRELRPFFGFDPDNFVLFSRHLATQNTDAFAIFGQTEYVINDRLTGSIGLRWSNEDRDYVYSMTLEEPTFEIPVFTQNGDISDDDVSGRIALDYQVDDNVHVYGSVSKGFKAGGFNGGFLFEPTPLISYDSETVLSYEVGLKGEYLDNRLRLNGAVFFYDYSDLQVFSFVNTGGLPTQVLTNAADAEISGAELEIDYVATDRLSLRFGLGLLDTELKDFQSFAGADLSGNKLPQAPDVSMTGMALYEIPLQGGGGFFLQADFSYQDDVFFLNDNNPLLAQDAYSLVNARISYAAPNDKWEIAIWGKNLADEEFRVSGFDLSDFGLYQIMRGPKLTYGIEGVLRFH